MADDVGRRVTVTWDAAVDWHDQPRPQTPIPPNEADRRPTPSRELVQKPPVTKPVSIQPRPDLDARQPGIQGWLGFAGAALFGLAYAEKETVLAVGGTLLALVVGIGIVAVALIAVRSLVVWFLRPIIELINR